MAAKTWSAILAALSVLLQIGSAFALEGTYLFASVSYRHGWHPWYCVMERNLTLVQGGNSYGAGYYPWSCDSENPNLLYSYGKKNLSSRDCPFEELAMYGLPCNGRAQSPLPSAFYRQISIPEDIKLSTMDGFVVDNEICTNERVKMNMGNRTGEWWKRGGVEDSPPIQWVMDAPSLAKRIVDYHKQLPDELLNDTAIIQAPEEPFLDEFGITVHPPLWTMVSLQWGQYSYIINVSNATESEKGVGALFLPTAGNVVCSLKQKGSDTLSSGSSYSVGMEIDIEADVLCTYYLYGNSFYGKTFSVPTSPDTIDKRLAKMQTPTILQYGPGAEKKSTWETWDAYNINYTKPDDLFRIGTIKFQKKLKVVEPTEAKLEIQSFVSPPEGEEKLARLIVKNTGNGKASIDGIKSSGRERKLICDKKELEPGQSSECVAIIDRNDRNLRLSYSEWPCGRPKHNVLAISVESKAETGESYCQASEDCSIGEECCVNLCRPAAEGVCDDIDSDGILDTWVPFGR